MWKCDNAQRTQLYNCNVCLERKLYSTGRGRICFKYDTFPQSDGQERGQREGALIPVPEIDQNGKPKTKDGNQADFEERWADSDDFLNILDGLLVQIPELAAWEVKQAFFPTVCPTSLADPVIHILVSVESACSEYKYDVMDAEIRGELLGFQMSASDTAEAFEIIRGAKADFRRHQEQVMKSEEGKGS